MQVWSFALLKNETRLVTGSSDLELRVYFLSAEESSSGGEELTRLGSKRRPEGSERRVSLHLMTLGNFLLFCGTIFYGLYPV